MEDSILTNQAISDFVKTLRVSDELKTKLLEKISFLDVKERIEFVSDLIKIHLLDLEEEKAIARVRKFWKG